MSLDLDPRQRAMLQEMGVQVWWPAADQALTAAPVALPLAPSPPLPATAPRSQSGAPAPSSTAPMAPQGTPAPVRAAPPPRASAASNTPAETGDAAMAPAPWVCGAPQPLFPQADPAHTPADLGDGWLLVAEDAGGSDPFAGEAGRLLHNMLHALRLHHHPRVFLCTLQAPAPADAAPSVCADVLAAALAAVQPSVVLVMGRVAARAVLGRSEPLGQLRAVPHTVAGIPAVVTYGATYLLRAPPATKALAWADLCRARALAAGDSTSATA